MPNKETKKESNKFNYEEALDKLEGIIEAMEDGSIPLADLVSQFEEGAQLLKLCQKELKQAELKVNQLDIDDAMQSDLNSE
ncbi:MAG: exodeoxyribonuclease VII small subunit [Puniceicoccaceae bacterium]|nr:exodeoxyribonuclease VII small subunit [Puniceicoccaceae bacterium]|tara:strand:- start:1226 stop:1468 length:243 start_codon:yes stop_codon:yes gene_type:complete